MATLHNPTGHRLFCYRIERFLDADERVEITDEEAADLEHNTVFTVEGYGEPVEEEAVPADDGDDDAADEDPASATPVRETVKRGSKRVEVTKAPEPETRG